jgi:hypothetical protein
MWLASILRKLGTSTSDTSCFLHNSWEPTTIALYLNVAFYIHLYWDILNIPQVVKFPDFLPSGMSVHFIPYRKGKIKTIRKKSARLVTLPVNGQVFLWMNFLDSVSCRLTLVVSDVTARDNLSLCNPRDSVSAALVKGAWRDWPWPCDEP